MSEQDKIHDVLLTVLKYLVHGTDRVSYERIQTV